jgi:eukaryotic-like serine/threonine-protein kinase
MQGAVVVAFLAMATPDPDPRIGHVIDGRYRILERLAQGGMGIVYKAERVPIGKTVAVKFLHGSYAEDKPSLARFERETRVLSKLTHPNCVSVIDFGVDGSPYLVMDYAGGTTLRAVLDAGKIPLSDSVAILRQVLAGLAHAHSQGIVHRDIKPANIMISDEVGTGRHVRLLDFGLARLASASSLTQTSVAIGTPSYMAPEQTVGGEVDVRTDIYQVGVVMFEMITGERLFVADDTSTLLEMHRTAKVPKIAEVTPGAESKPGMDEVIQKALAKAPADRWQTAMELANALDDVVSGRWRKPRSPLKRAGAVAAILLVAGAATAGVLHFRRGAEAPRLAGGEGSAVVAQAAGDARAPALVEAGASPVGSDAATAAAAALDAGVPAVDASAVAAVIDAGVTSPDAGSLAGDAAVAAIVDAGAISALADAGSPAIAVTGAAVPDSGDDGEAVVAEELDSADPEAAERSQDPADDRPVVAPPPPPAAPLAKTLPAVTALIKKGQRELAITSLHTMWKKSPRDARLPYLLGNLYFDKRWWTIGMQYYHAAIARLPAYKGNQTLIRNVINAIGNSKTRGKAIYLLTKVIGSGAKGLVRAASRNHSDPAVRKAAQSLIKRW